MKMRVDTPARLATVTLDEDTMLDVPALDLFIRKAMDEPCGLMALELLIPASDMNSPQLQKRGFVVAGNVCENAVTLIKMRKKLSAPSFADTPRSVFFNPEIQTSAPVLQQSKEERAAHSNLSVSLERHYSDDAVNRRLAQIEAEASTSTVKKGRDEASDITATANRLAKVVTRKSETK